MHKTVDALTEQVAKAEGYLQRARSSETEAVQTGELNELTLPTSTSGEKA